MEGVIKGRKGDGKGEGGKEGRGEGKKEEGKNILLPFFFAKAYQFSSFVSKDKSKIYKQEKDRSLILSLYFYATHALFTMQGNHLYTDLMFIVSLFQCPILVTEEQFLALGDQGSQSK